MVISVLLALAADAWMDRQRQKAEDDYAFLVSRIAEIRSRLAMPAPEGDFAAAESPDVR